MEGFFMPTWSHRINRHAVEVAKSHQVNLTKLRETAERVARNADSKRIERSHIETAAWQLKSRPKVTV